MFGRDYYSVETLIAMLRETVNGQHPKLTHDVFLSYKKQERARIHELEKEVLHKHRFFKVLGRLVDRLEPMKKPEYVVTEKDKKDIRALLNELEIENELIENEARIIDHMSLTG